MLAHGISAIREHLASLPSQENLTLEQKRGFYDKAVALFPTPDGIDVQTSRMGGVEGELHRPRVRDDGHIVLYLHGGGYAIGSAQSHRHMVAAIALASRSEAFAINYRLAPEYPFPAALEDALDAYRGLLDGNYHASRIVIAGDSAGGGLTAALALAIKRAGLSQPAAMACISPWADLSNTAKSYETKAEVDPMVRPADIRQYAGLYLGDASDQDPFASPVHGDFNGICPMLIQVGSDEVLVDDAELLANRARAAGVNVTFEVWDKMIHVWHWFGHFLDEAGEATQRIGEFARAHTHR
ncbi:MAG: alpha/beta hydrolase [Gammaproteobacteria bacterium]|nr:alpha/beta hydrolase [Gammaproteobacteria bacterium]